MTAIVVVVVVVVLVVVAVVAVVVGVVVAAAVDVDSAVAVVLVFSFFVVAALSVLQWTDGVNHVEFMLQSVVLIVLDSPIKKLPLLDLWRRWFASRFHALLDLNSSTAITPPRQDHEGIFRHFACSLPLWGQSLCASSVE